MPTAISPSPQKSPPRHIQLELQEETPPPPPPPTRRHQLELQSDGEVPTAPRRGKDVWVVAATTVGNALEWYDFALFGFLAPELARRFFPPNADETSALLKTFIVFGAAFAVRPLGGLALGAFSDRRGRRAALQASVAAMSGATAAIGALPTYAQAGSLATCLLVLCRLVQGLSVAGQLTGALVFLVESAPPGHEHLFGSLAFASGNAGTMLGGLAVALVRGRYGADGLGSYGWRYPFLLSAVLGVAGYYVQSLAEESPAYLAAVAGAGAPQTPGGTPKKAQPADVAAAAALRESGPKVAAVAAACCLSPAAFYALFVFAPAFYGGAEPPLPRATELATRCLGLSCIVLPLAGALVDARRSTHGEGAVPVFLASSALALGVVAPMTFGALGSGDAFLAGTALTAAAIAHSCFNAALAGWLVRAFDPRARGTILGAAWNVAAALVGGTAPATAVFLVEISHSDLAPGFYISALAALAVWGVRVLEAPKEVLLPPPHMPIQRDDEA
mmetsp:Transcript_18539/g.55123  ORF Transcript_18539/g.55123 Transcript_18539/m.55123 type:complete len:504 (+) Transcript_18539:193-1704(+)